MDYFFKSDTHWCIIEFINNLCRNSRLENNLLPISGKQLFQHNFDILIHDGFGEQFLFPWNILFWPRAGQWHCKAQPSYQCHPNPIGWVTNPWLVQILASISELQANVLAIVKMLATHFCSLQLKRHDV
ncbi:MAG: hypothetical protein G8345_11345 [Magnetococcales bacterium]|nr:hypothetical protein [Magnetococcales bacterium]